MPSGSGVNTSRKVKSQYETGWASFWKYIGVHKIRQVAKIVELGCSKVLTVESVVRIWGELSAQRYRVRRFKSLRPRWTARPQREEAFDWTCTAGWSNDTSRGVTKVSGALQLE